MSSPEPRQLTLSPKSRQDAIDVLRYAGAIWGEGQLLAFPGNPALSP
jgi:hypothetical protein